MELPNLIVSSLLASYQQISIGKASGIRVPSRSGVDDLCLRLLQIIFPGRQSGRLVNDSESQARISAAARALLDEIANSLSAEGFTKQSPEEITLKLFSDLPLIRRVIATDLEAGFDGDPAARSIEEIVLSYPYVDAVSIQRMAHHLYAAGVQLLPRMMTEWAHGRTGIDIHPGASIGSHFFIDHGTGVVIGESCRLGHHVKLYHAVTLGARSFQKDEEGKIAKGGKRHPDVGDNVTIYPYATILGGKTVIGAGSTIGANVFLIHGVPERSLVYLDEGVMKIISKKSVSASQAGV